MRLPLLRLVFLALCACPRAQTPEPNPQPRTEPTESAEPPRIAELAGYPKRSVPIQDAACEARACWILTSGSLRSFHPDTLEVGPELARVPDEATLSFRGGIGWELGDVWTGLDGSSRALDAPIPAIDELPFDVDHVRLRWNQLAEESMRIPFERAWPLPDGGLLNIQPGLMGRTSSLVRVGGRARAVSLPSSESTVRYPGALALHPTGTQTYHLSWPAGALGAYDATSLREIWSLDLPPAAHGLFITPDGRFLLASAGGGPDRGRFTDYPIVGPLRPGEGPASDAALRRRARPDSTRTILVDLVTPDLLVDTAGSYLRWIPIDATRSLLVTTQGILQIDAPPLP